MQYKYMFFFCNGIIHTETFLSDHQHSDCVDSNPEQCPVWKAKNQCTLNKAYMVKNCAKSCLCGRS